MIICDKCYLEILKYKIDYNSQNVYSLFDYEDVIRNSILRYKFEDFSHLHNLFAFCIFNSKKAYNFLNLYDIIMPVPVSKKRKLERGYNQTELIARDIAILMYERHRNNNQILFENNILKKIKNTKSQSELTGMQRITNLENAFSVDNKKNDLIKNKKILLLDDVYTTGSTYRECKKTLLDAGASKVGIITIAKSRLK